MADSSVLLEVIVEGKNIKLVQRDVEELGNSINRTSSAQDRNTTSSRRNTSAMDEGTAAANRYSRGQKGVAGATSNTTKAFSKQRDLIGGGGFVAAYATIAANVFAITAAFDVLRRNAALRQLEEGLNQVGAAAGRNLPLVAERLQEITGYAIDSGQAMRSTALALSAGFSTKQLGDLAKVARGASIALGRDMGDALDRLVRGTAKIEPEILDELGIIVRLDDAVRDYAASIGTTANKLTTFQRSQAFLNATVEQGLKKFGDLNEVVEPNAYDQLAASFKDLGKAILDLTKYIDPVIRFFAANSFALGGALALIGAALLKSILPGLQSVASASAAFSATVARQAKMAATTVNTQWTTQINNVVAAANKMGTALNNSMRNALPALQQGNLTIKQLQRELRFVTQAETLRFNALKAQGLGATQTKINEYNATVALRQEIEKLIETESRRNVSGQTGQTRRGQSVSARATSRTLTQIGNATNPIQLLSATMRGLGVQIQNVGRQAGRAWGTLGAGQGILVGLRVAATAAGNAIKILGFAFLNAIPFIGQGLFIFSLIKPLLDSMFGQDKYTKAANSATEAFSNFALVAERLNKVLGDIKRTEIDKFFARLTVQAGNAKEVSEAVAAYKKSLVDEETKEEINDLGATIYRLQSQIEQYQSSSNPELFTESIEDSTRLLEAARAKLQKLTAESTDITPDNKGGAIQVINIAIERLRATGLAQQNADGKWVGALADNAEAYQNIITNIKNGTITTLQGVEDAAIAAGKGSEAAVSAQKAIEEGWSEISKAQTAATTKGETEYTQFASLISKQANEVREVWKKAGLSIAEGGKEVRESLSSSKEITNLRKNIKLVGDTVDQNFNSRLEEAISNFTDFGSVFDSPASILEAVGVILEENNGIINVSKEKAAELTAQAKAFGEVSKANVGIARIQAELQRQATDEQIKGVRATLENEKLMNGESAKAIKLRAELVALEAKRLDDADQIFMIEQASVNQAKRLLDISNKITAAKNAQRKAALDQLRLEMEIANAQTFGSTSLSADQEVTLAKKAAEDIQKIENEKYGLKIQGIMLEWQLLNAQMDLEKAKIDRLVKEGKLSAPEAEKLKGTISNVQSSGTGLAQAQIEAANAERELNIARAEGAVSIAEALRDEKLRTLEIEKQQTLIESLSRFKGTSALVGKMSDALFEDKKALLESQIAAANAASDTARAAELINELKKVEIQQEDALLERRLQNAAALGGQYQYYVQMTEQAKLLKEELDGMVASGAISQQDANMVTLLNSVENLKGSLRSTAQAFREIGPEGELMGGFLDSFVNMADTIQNAMNVIGDANASMGDKVMAFASGAMGVAQQLGSMYSATAKMKVQQIDNEIAAEKKRDGKSKESLAKIASLEKKKEAQQRKAFEMDKKMKIAQTVMATYQGAMSAYSAMAGIPVVGPVLGALAAAAVIAMGAQQIAAIKSSTFEGSSTPSAGGEMAKVSAGERRSTIDLATSKSASGELGYLRGESGTGGPENFTPAFMGSKYRAMGGSTGYVVGEQGPELFVPDRPGTVVPADDTRAITGQAPNVNFNINAIDARGVEQVLLEQRGNIIGMLRESANSYGNGFFEEVDLGLYTPSAMGAKRA